jgi:hypothetical protein
MTRSDRISMLVRLAALAIAAASGFSQEAGAQGPPIPVPRPGQSVVQFVNESTVTLLLGALGPTGFGCQPPSQPGTPACPGDAVAGSVLPREGTWVLGPGAWLTVDIPLEWQKTQQKSQGNPEGGRLGPGPRFWARTGCRYEQAHNIAQCETGDWAGMYDAFQGPAMGQRLPYGPQNGGVPAGISPNTFTEWCFNCGNDFNYWDVSAVDGGDLSVDIQPLGAFSPHNPLAPGDVWWCQTNNSIPGADLRAAAVCPDAFQLKRSQLSSYVAGSEDHVVACFSNCGRYKYPIEPPQDCTDATDPRCSAWKRYCCTAGASEYDKECTSDADCSFGNACFENKCTCRGWIVDPPCPESVCTNQGPAGGVPDFGTCSAAAGPLQCIGDDTVHRVLPRAFSWPNDPQTYDCDARIFRVTFAPGGTSVPITDASAVPQCGPPAPNTLPAAYDYARWFALCATPRANGALYAGATLPPTDWQCAITSVADGVLCTWPSKDDAPVALGQVHRGAVTRVGAVPAVAGRGRGALELSGSFTFFGPMDLSAPGAKVSILTGLDAGGNGGELVQGVRLALAADGRNSTTRARFRTARGETPAAVVSIGRRGRGRFDLLLEMSRATVAVPEACPQLELATTLQLDDGTNPPLVVAIKEPWRCVQRGTVINVLRTP